MPSQVAKEADTFDVYVMDLAAKWDRRQREKAQGIDHTPQYSVEELAAILEANKDE